MAPTATRVYVNPNAESNPRRPARRAGASLQRQVFGYNGSRAQRPKQGAARLEPMDRRPRAFGRDDRSREGPTSSTASTSEQRLGRTVDVSCLELLESCGPNGRTNNLQQLK